MTARELRPLYKKLLRLAQALPESKRQTSLDQVRREFRQHVDLTDTNEYVVAVVFYRRGVTGRVLMGFVGVWLFSESLR